MNIENYKLGKYALQNLIGEGTFGWVFKATDNLDRVVAIKVLKPGWADDTQALERFRREAVITSQLYHNRIATIIEFDEFEGRRFLAMRYVDGISLKRLLKENGKIPWKRSLQILSQVAEGLDYAHARGLIHRDITLDNILVSETEGAVITDFGLAKASTMNKISSSGVILGTPYYIAPEIWSGGQTSPSTDVYSLACVAYEILTGKVLFSGQSTPEIMTRHMLYAPAFGNNWADELPSGIEASLSHALEKNPENRYKSILEFITDLEKLDQEETPPDFLTDFSVENKQTNWIPYSQITEMATTTEKKKNIFEVHFQNNLENTSEQIDRGKKTDGNKILRWLILSLSALAFVLVGLNLKSPVQQVLASTKIGTFIFSNDKIGTAKIPLAPNAVSTYTSKQSNNMINTLIRDQDGMEMVFIAGGAFIAGSNLEDVVNICRNLNDVCQPDWFNDEQLLQEKNIDGFWVDKTEVTNSMYAKCVQAGVCSLPTDLSSNTRPDYYENYGGYPVVNIGWNQARIYCAWAGGRLPSEFEWEKAARGIDGRMFPWGNSTNSLSANIDGSDTKLVGSYENGASPFGVYDMAGNVWEWTTDLYDTSEKLANKPTPGSESNYYVIRGGSWNSSFLDIRSSNRDSNQGLITHSDLGFRCVRNK